MDVHPVDPRDTTWEIGEPVYRVHFFRPQRSRDPGSGWVSDEWEIANADIDEALNWARQNAAGRRFVIYVRVIAGQPGKPGLVRLAGTDLLDE